jgi:methyl-accepting chemotaxis protein
MGGIMKTLSLVVALSLMSSASFANCTKDQAKASVEKICDIISKKGDGAKDEIKKFRYCGTNYVWVQDSDVKMVVHPIKGRLNGRDLKRNKDKKGKHLFVEFDKMAKTNAAGGWVEYYWTKPGEEAPTPKVSFVKLCGGDKKWIAGSGIWK